LSRQCYTQMYYNHLSVTYNDAAHAVVDPATGKTGYDLTNRSSPGLFSFSSSSSSSSSPAESTESSSPSSSLLYPYAPPSGELRQSLAKVVLMQRAIAEFNLSATDWVVWMDRDTYIVDPNVILGDVLLETEKYEQKSENNNDGENQDDQNDDDSGEEACESDTKKKSSSSSSNLPHLVVGAGDGNLLSTRFFAMRASPWGRAFLDEWLRGHRGVVFGGENGPFLHTVLRALIKEDSSSGATYDDECSTYKLHADQMKEGGSLPPTSDSAFWKQDFVAPFLKCYEKSLKNTKKYSSFEMVFEDKKTKSDAAENNSGNDQTTTASSSSSLCKGNFGNSWIPANSKNIRFECLLSDKKFYNKEPTSWINQGDLASYNKWAIDIGNRFSPRCF
jgi:hypothetical protein